MKACTGANRINTVGTTKSWINQRKYPTKSQEELIFLPLNLADHHYHVERSLPVYSLKMCALGSHIRKGFNKTESERLLPSRARHEA